MHEVDVTRPLEHDADAVWAVFDNFPDIATCHPVVATSESVNGQRTGVGARRRCTMQDGATVIEEIVAYDAAARTLSIRVVDHGPYPMSHMEVDVSVSPTDTGCTVSFHSEFEPRYGPVGWLMAKTLMRGQFSKVLGQLVDGVDAHLRKGQDGVLV